MLAGFLFSKDEGLFGQAGRSKVLPNIFIACLWAYLFLSVGQLLGYLIWEFSVAPWLSSHVQLGEAFKASASIGMGFVFISLMIFARVKFREKRSLVSLGFDKLRWGQNYLVGFGIGLAMFSAVVLALVISGHVVVQKDFTLHFLTGVLILLPGWMIQSATEEILARGWLMNVLGARYNALVGLVVSSLFFGMIHLFNPHVNTIAIVNIVLVGLFLGLYVIKTQNLWGACGFHAAWNWAQGNLFGFPVSGLHLDDSTLIKMGYDQESILNGGSFGPEAGLIATVFLVIGIVVLLYLLQKNRKKDMVNDDF